MHNHDNKWKIKTLHISILLLAFSITNIHTNKHLVIIWVHTLTELLYSTSAQPPQLTQQQHINTASSAHPAAAHQHSLLSSPSNSTSTQPPQLTQQQHINTASSAHPATAHQHSLLSSPSNSTSTQPPQLTQQQHINTASSAHPATAHQHSLLSSPSNSTSTQPPQLSQHDHVYTLHSHIKYYNMPSQTSA